ncbi:hypothetical protein [Clostridium sp.]|uniref:hypothetical protein n=1 Tax=Clostridium sp. TaxID=1506 RepID=UPI001A5DC316|nr:hypothetical protein [Clostridium sp.]MBK5242988.1 hypothetical protein [Clostridium sp.]
MAQTMVANTSINSTNGDVLFLYESDGNIYLRVSGDRLEGYDLNVSNSSLYFDSDNDQNTASVSVTSMATNPLTINSINIQGDFSLDRAAIGSQMINNQIADINVTFTPTHTGTSTGKIIINYGSPAEEKIINLTGVRAKEIDSTPPIFSVSGNPTTWTNSNVTLSVSASDTGSGLNTGGAYSFDDGKTWQESNKKVYDQNTDGIVVKVRDVTGNIATYETINIDKIDKIKPIITGASDSTSYFIGRVIKLNDTFGEIAEATYKNGTNTETSFKDSDLFEKAGKYTLTLKDKAGNSQILSFEIKELPKAQDVVYTTEFKALLDGIRAEFDKRNDMPEAYKTATEIKIKALEDDILR